MADVHLQICDSLRENVEKEIALWKKENFRKSAIGLCKEAKTLEEDFKKASQPFDLDLSSHSHVIAVIVFLGTETVGKEVPQAVEGEEGVPPGLSGGKERH